MTPNRKLLRDLGDLAGRYRARDWEELAAWIDDPVRRETLRVLLEELAAASRKRRSPRKRRPPKESPNAQVDQKLAELERVDTARAVLLSEIWIQLKAKDLLPTLASVRVFADQLGLKGIKGSRREVAIAELMEHLIRIPEDSLESMMRETVVRDRQLADEYERWVNLILRHPPSD